jgi:serine/threonine-protein kinase
MASVHTARLVAGEGVSRLVAAKRLHPQFLDEPDFVAMFHDEARIASQIHHPNVVPVLDIVCEGEEVILVQEYVHGVPLSYLFKHAIRSQRIPLPIVAAVMGGVLAGLHAAHEATDELGEPLKIVHRDVSPQNVLVSVDGVPRLVDFGIAKAKSNVHHTREGIFKGKLAYMAPEQIRAHPVTRQADVYAAGVMLWELVVNRRFYDGKNDAEFVRAVALGRIPTIAAALEAERAAMPPGQWDAILRLEPIVARALSPQNKERYLTAHALAVELAAAIRSASAPEVAAWVTSAGADFLAKRQQLLVENEASTRAQNVVQLLQRERDDEVHASGARVRALIPGETGSVTMSAPPTGPHSGISSRSEEARARAILPWTLVGALLVVVGVLAGVVLTSLHFGFGVFGRPEGDVRGIASNESSARVPTAAPSATPAAPAEPVSSPATSRPAPVRPAPVRVIYQPVPVAARPTPIPVMTPVPLPPSARPDCSPPFYFEGTKKVFKPNCI